MTERLGYYAVGVAIGLLLVGLLLQARQSARQAAAPGPTVPAVPAVGTPGKGP